MIEGQSDSVGIGIDVHFGVCRDGKLTLPRKRNHHVYRKISSAPGGEREDGFAEARNLEGHS